MHPVKYDKMIEDSFNGKTNPRVNIIDIGCGYGGLLC